MNKSILPAIVALVVGLNWPLLAQTANSGAKPPIAAGGTNTGRPAVPAAPSQSELASTTALFEVTARTGERVKAALDAHDLAAGLKLVDKAGAFKGTVTAIFEPRGGALAILNFDKEYRTAMTAVVRKDDFSKFPDLKKLVGKEVLVNGKIIDYQGRAELILTNLPQIKLLGEK